MNKARKRYSREELINMLNHEIEYNKRKLKRVRNSFNNKISYRSVINFYESLKYYLEKQKQNENDR